MPNNGVLHKAVFGGFREDDVLEYFEYLNNQSAKLHDDLQKELSKYKLENSVLKAELKSAYEQLEEARQIINSSSFPEAIIAEYRDESAEKSDEILAQESAIMETPEITAEVRNDYTAEPPLAADEENINAKSPEAETETNQDESGLYSLPFETLLENLRMEPLTTPEPVNFNKPEDEINEAAVPPADTDTSEDIKADSGEVYTPPEFELESFVPDEPLIKPIVGGEEPLVVKPLIPENEPQKDEKIEEEQLLDEIRFEEPEEPLYKETEKEQTEEFEADVKPIEEQAEEPKKADEELNLSQADESPVEPLEQRYEPEQAIPEISKSDNLKTTTSNAELTRLIAEKTSLSIQNKGLKAQASILQRNIEQLKKSQPKMQGSIGDLTESLEEIKLQVYTILDQLNKYTSENSVLSSEEESYLKTLMDALQRALETLLYKVDNINVHEKGDL